jgi:hypothetical protein
VTSTVPFPNDPAALAQEIVSLRQRIEQLERGRRAPNTSVDNGQIQFLDGTGRQRVLIGDDPAFPSGAQRVSILVENPADPTGNKYAVLMGDYEDELDQFQTGTSFAVVREDGTQWPVVSTMLRIADPDPAEQRKLGTRYPLPEFQLCDVRNGSLQEHWVDSGTFSTQWLGQVPFATGSKIEATMNFAADVGTTGEYRCRVGYQGSDYFTTTEPIASGSNFTRRLNWEWMAAAVKVPPVFFVDVAIDVRRDTGAGKVYSRAQTGIVVSSSALGSGAVGGWV